MFIIRIRNLQLRLPMSREGLQHEFFNYLDKTAHEVETRILSASPDLRLLHFISKHTVFDHLFDHWNLTDAVRITNIKSVDIFTALTEDTSYFRDYYARQEQKHKNQQYLKFGYVGGYRVKNELPVDNQDPIIINLHKCGYDKITPLSRLFINRNVV